MSITAELCAEIRERVEFSRRTPLQYMKLQRNFRLGHQYHGEDLILWLDGQPDVTVLVGRGGRDSWGYRWYLNPGWRAEVKALVIRLGMDIQEDTEEVPF